MPKSRVNIRPARVDDVPKIHGLIKRQAEQGRMILRNFDELFANLREFVVGEVNGEVVGCAAVHIFWSDLAELKCLAVDETHQTRGVGRALSEACCCDMRRLGVRRLFALTTAPGFFEKVGYAKVNKDSLPRFIWGECTRCPSFPVCNEEALVLDL